jgi:hypothetical protein
MAHQTNDYGFLPAEQVTRTVLDRLNHWGTKAAQQPGLLNRAVDTTQRFEPLLPGLVDLNQASYLATRSFLSQPELPARAPPEPTTARDNSMSLVPWEAERRLRLLNAVFAGRIKAALLPLADWVKDYREGLGTAEPFLMEGWIAPASNGSPIISREQLARLLNQTWWQSYLSSWAIPLPLRLARLQASIRATELRLALIHFAAENQQAASTLADLVPKYIRAIPNDPYDGKPFRYRVSLGESIVRARTYQGVAATRDTRPGQGILWCIGPDLVDDHGAVEDADPLLSPKTKTTGDIVFIVPSVDELLR